VANERSGMGVWPADRGEAISTFTRFTAIDRQLAKGSAVTPSLEILQVAPFQRETASRRRRRCVTRIPARRVKALANERVRTRHRAVLMYIA